MKQKLNCYIYLLNTYSPPHTVRCSSPMVGPFCAFLGCRGCTPLQWIAARSLACTFAGGSIFLRGKWGMCGCPQCQSHTRNTHSNYYTICTHWKSLGCKSTVAQPAGQCRPHEGQFGQALLAWLQRSACSLQTEYNFVRPIVFHCHDRHNAPHVPRYNYPPETIAAWGWPPAVWAAPGMHCMPQTGTSVEPVPVRTTVLPSMTWWQSDSPIVGWLQLQFQHWQPDWLWG